MKIVILIERPDGTTYEQQVTVKPGDSIEQTLQKQQHMLGEDYWVCDYYIDEE